jgi:hypothetical protein
LVVLRSGGGIVNSSPPTVTREEVVRVSLCISCILQWKMDQPLKKTDIYIENQLN